MPARTIGVSGVLVIVPAISRAAVCVWLSQVRSVLRPRNEDKSARRQAEQRDSRKR